MFKKIVIAIILVVFLLLIIFFSLTISIFKKKDNIKIGLSLSTLSESRWAREKELIIEEAKRYGMEVIVQSAEKDDSRQMKQIENLVANGVKAIIIVAQNPDSIVSSVEFAKSEGVPCIAYDRAIYSNDVSLYISFDTVKVGFIEANALLSVVPYGNYLILCGSPKEDEALLVRQGQYNALGTYINNGQINIIGEYWCNDWSPGDALKYTENVLTVNNNKIDAILAADDSIAGGAILALENQKLSGKIPIAGQNAELAACQRIVQGTQTLTIFKNFSLLSKEAVIATWEIINGEKPSRINSSYINQKKNISIESIILDTTAVNKDNIKEVIVYGGFYSYNDVYGKK